MPEDTPPRADQPATEPSQTPAQADGITPSAPPAGETPPPTSSPADATPSRLSADALADGTKPTILTQGEAPQPKLTKGHSSLASLYRRADIMTTLFTFGGALLAALIVLGAYLYITRSKTTTTAPPKVTTLSQADLTKLGAFFAGNSAGKPAEILTITSSSLFNGRVGVNNDLKVTGGLSVDGPTALSALTVDKATTLGITQVRGQLTVAGPIALQSPAIFSAGASVTGNVTVSGNGSFGGSLSAGLLNITNLTVTGTLSLAGHLAISGQTPGVSPADGAGASASASVDGNDSAGTVTITTGSLTTGVLNSGGLLVNITFHAPYGRVPHIIISADGASTGSLSPYVQKTTTGFTIGTATGAKGGTAYSFDYWVVQ